MQAIYKFNFHADEWLGLFFIYMDQLLYKPFIFPPILCWILFKREIEIL